MKPEPVEPAAPRTAAPRPGGPGRPAAKWLPPLALALLLAGGLALSLLGPSSGSARPARGGFLNGGWAAGVQERYERGLFLRPAAERLWGAVRYLLFREGQAGVLIGKEGWLFTTEEFVPAADESGAIEAAVEYVSGVRDRLRERGIGLIVALVPSKARLYPDRLGRYRFPAYAAARYERFRRGLQARGVAAPDLAASLREARSEGEVFLRTDTHWTPLGARAAAAAVARVGRGELARLGVPPAVFETRLAGRRSLSGDLLRFVSLGPLLEGIGPPPDTVPVYRTAEQGPVRLGLFDRVDIPVALVGTSYSAGELWNFEGALKEQLRADVLNVAEEGQGPFAPLRAFLDSDTLRDAPPRLVVWEIPERYLPSIGREPMEGPPEDSGGGERSASGRSRG